jgi:hypothetical protein
MPLILAFDQVTPSFTQHDHHFYHNLILFLAQIKTLRLQVQKAYKQETSNQQLHYTLLQLGLQVTCTILSKFND